MIGKLLLRGMIAGMIAAVLTFGFAQIFGEPPIEAAIALEDQAAATQADAHTADMQPGTLPHAHDPAAHGASDHEAEAAAGHDHGDGAVFSRSTQSGVGLLTGLVVFGAAIGGAFAVTFALLHGRLGPSSPLALSILLGLAGFTVLALVPGLKYPANPPAVGSAETIGLRTTLFFGMVLASVVSAVIAISAGRMLAATQGKARASVIALALFAGLVAVACLALPSYNEVPASFPEDVLRHFRLASMGIRAVLWLGIGAIFGVAADRLLRSPPRPLAR